MQNFIVGAIIVVIVGLASIPIVRSRQRGIKCIGCAHSSSPSCDCDDSFISRHQVNWIDEYRKDHKKVR